MNKKLGEQLKKASSDEALHLICSLLASKDTPDMSVNSWLYLYEILYTHITGTDKKAILYAEAAAAILSYLESINSSDMNLFLVQELNLRVLLIKAHGLGSGLLDPEYVFTAVKRKLGSTNLESIPENWRILETREEIVALRNIKNLLGPISLLKEIGIEKKFYSSWLLIREQLP